MTNEEAIERIKVIRWEHATNKCPDREALDIAIKALEENTALNLLVDWAIQCDFGFDNFPEEYEKYKEDIKELGYKEGMVYIAKKEANND